MMIAECQKRKNINVHLLPVVTAIATDILQVLLRLQNHIESLLYKLISKEGIKKKGLT